MAPRERVRIGKKSKSLVLRLLSKDRVDENAIGSFAKFKAKV